QPREVGGNPGRQLYRCGGRCGIGGVRGHAARRRGWRPVPEAGPRRTPAGRRLLAARRRLAWRRGPGLLARSGTADGRPCPRHRPGRPRRTSCRPSAAARVAAGAGTGINDRGGRRSDRRGVWLLAGYFAAGAITFTRRPWRSNVTTPSTRANRVSSLARLTP